MPRRGRRRRSLPIGALLSVLVGAYPAPDAAATARQSTVHARAHRAGTIATAGRVRAASGAADLLSYVNPFGGTGAQAPIYGTGGVFAFPGADVPFGMVQWSPDTTSDRAGGYTFGDPAIRGFSLTHLHGVGCPIFQDVPFMPALAPPTVSPATDRHALAARFAHADERASPGYYGVRLGSGIGVELTTTTRTGFGRFTYPSSSGATMTINAGGSIERDGASSGVRIDPAAHTVTGSATSGGFCSAAPPAYTPHNSYTVYFAAQFDHPFAGYGTWNGPAIEPGAIASSGGQSGAYVRFDTTRNPVVLVKVGVSFVGVRNALANLRSENTGWDFAAVRAAAGARWSRMLDRVRVQGGTLADRQTFYTALYHALLHPNVFGDADGQYRGFDGRVHSAVYGPTHTPYTQYANYSGWDIYRSEVPLLALVAPRETGDMMQSLLSDAQQGGALPRWALANMDTGIMVGDPSDLIIAGAYAFGATRFDTMAALRAMVAGATQPDLHPNGVVARPGLPEYLRLGYVPTDDFWVWGSAATTLEYGSADFALSRFATALGRPGTSAVAAIFLRRARNWRHLFNPASGYMQPRRADGRFVTPFDPASDEGFVESSAAQNVWLVPYDLRGLADALGGRVTAARRLDAFFAQINAGPTSPYAYLGNEPSEGAPWEYDSFGQPWRTQETVRRIMRDLYHPTPDGIPGNDDLGQLSSWYVWAALGLYPEIPGAPILVLGSPLFPRATLQLAGGAVTITAPNAADDRPYVQGLTVNGRGYDKTWLPSALLAHGAQLRFELGSRPNRAWGTSPASAPPSFEPTRVTPRGRPVVPRGEAVHGDRRPSGGPSQSTRRPHRPFTRPFAI